MNHRVEIDPQVAVDVEETFAFLSRTAVSLARRFTEAVADTIIEIQHDPKIGQRWESRQRRLAGLLWKRIRGFRKYLVFYRVEGDTVRVCRVLHGARDLHNLL